MVVDRFLTLEQLDSIKSRWTELYEGDPEASLFLSWEWIRACLSTERRSWLVLGVRDGALPHVAFVPFNLVWSPLTGRGLSLGLAPRADFSGMLGAPGADERFIPALAQEIQRLNWDSFTLNNCADRRASSLIREFSPRRFRIVPSDSTPSPYVQLPPTWDEYLMSRGSSTRRTLRSHLNRLRSLPGYCLRFAPPDEAAEGIETLLRLHSLRWKTNLVNSRRALAGFLASCAASGRFRVCAMRQGDSTIAVQGFFVEQARRTIVTYMIAHNPEYAQYSPGVMLTCESIRCAIEEGYHHYSLSLGDQGYKTSLATDVQFLTNAMLWRRSARAAAIDGGQRAFTATKSLARKVFDFRSASKVQVPR